MADTVTQNGVLVFLEFSHGEIADVSYELIYKAGELARQLGVTSHGVLVSDTENSKNYERIFKHQCDFIHPVIDKRLSFYETLPYTKIISEVITALSPQVVLFGATAIGRDLAPRVASKLRTGLTADCTDLQIGDHEDRKQKKIYKDILYQIRPAFGGNILATIIAPDHRPQMATVREGVMKVGELVDQYPGKVIPMKIPLDEELFVNTLIDRSVKAKKVNLKTADIIVSGGGGVGSLETFKLIHDLAETLGGMVGASRAAVDSGFIGKEHQVGQTGTTIRPKLYIAAGISGQIQHRAGMEESGKIIAINTDPDAPIFKIAHYGIVGDLQEVIPMMIKAYKSKD